MTPPREAGHDSVIVERLKALALQLDRNLSPEDLDPEAPLLAGGLDLDSIALLELIVSVEEAYGFQFDEAELCMEAFGSLGRIARTVSGKLNPALAA